MFSARHSFSPDASLPYRPLADSLQIIASRPKTSRGGRGGRRGAGATRTPRAAAPAAGAASNARARYAGAAPGSASAKPLQATQAEAVKVIISNLPTDVDEAQIRVRSPTLKIGCY